MGLPVRGSNPGAPGAPDDDGGGGGIPNGLNCVPAVGRFAAACGGGKRKGKMQPNGTMASIILKRAGSNKNKKMKIIIINKKQ